MDILKRVAFIGLIYLFFLLAKIWIAFKRGNVLPDIHDVEA